MNPAVQSFFHEPTFTVSYLVGDPDSRKAAIVDPVLDFDPKSGRTGHGSADGILAAAAAGGMEIAWILETHVHADHLSATAYLKEKTGAPMATGAKVVEVQCLWKAIYNLGDDFPTDGSQWDRLFADGEIFKVGSMPVEVMHCPGHTLASITFVAGDAAFVHDTLFMPDGGTARTDFPGGSAKALWHSIQRILSLPDTTRLFTGHDYKPNGRPPAWESTVAQQKQKNIHLLKAPTEEAYVAMRQARDKTLPMPKLILHALQVNIRGGRLPEPEADGKRYLKIPIDALPGAAWD